MTRYIDADALFDAYEKSGWYNNADRDEIAEKLLLEQPTVEAEPHWIPVSERLPDRIGRYLVYSTTIPMWEHFILNYDPEYNQWFWDGFRSEDCDINVLAWMPLPRHYEVNHEQIH